MDGLNPEDEDYEAKREILSQQLQSCQAQLEDLKSQLTDLSALIAARQQLDLLEAQRDSCGLTDTTADALQAQLDALYTTDSEGQTVPVGTAVFLAGQQQIQQGWEQIADGRGQSCSSRVPAALLCPQAAAGGRGGAGGCGTGAGGGLGPSWKTPGQEVEKRLGRVGECPAGTGRRSANPSGG